MKILSVSLLLFLVMASLIFAQTTTIAVNEFEYSRVSRSTMMKTATDISNSIYRQAPRWRVLYPDYIAKNIRGANIAQGGSHRERSIGIGRYFSADLVLVGVIGNDEMGYTVGIQLVDVNNGNTLFEYENRYKDIETLNKTASDIAARIVNSIEKPEQQNKRVERPKLRYSTGISLGQESVTSTAMVPGGSHLYLALSGTLNDTLGIEARYSVGMFPDAFSNTIFSATMLLNIPYAKDAGILLGAGYSAATTNYATWSHMMRFTLHPIYSGETDDFVFSLLPMSLSYDIHTSEYLFSFQLLSMSVLF